MDFINFYKNKLFSTNKDQFEALALELFHYQAVSNTVYKNYLHAIGRHKDEVKCLNDIPFLPAELFRTHEVVCGQNTAGLIFSSSSTSGAGISRHFVKQPSLYEESFERCFSLFYGEPADYCILALLPSYLERSGSSLIYMMERLIKSSRHPDSGFYLYEHEQLADLLEDLKNKDQRCILFGVTFGLLDFSVNHSFHDMQNLIVIETGGMKGRRAELTREEVHLILKEKLGVENIHSEYGMTELLSQAYSKGNGIFSCPPWMKVLVRDPQDPFCIINCGSTGAVNIIDLANADSCAFIATSDLGKVHEDGTFEISGRFDYSDVRGCNLMVL